MGNQIKWTDLFRSYKVQIEQRILEAVCQSCRTFPNTYPMYEYVALNQHGARGISLPENTVVFPRRDELLICRLQWANCIDDPCSEKSLKHYLKEQGYWDVLTQGIQQDCFSVWDLDIPEDIVDRWKEWYQAMYQEDACVIAGSHLMQHAYEIAERADIRNTSARR